MEMERDARSEENPSVNILVMSDSGKPIFSRCGKEEDIARVTGLLQAVRSSILYNKTLGLGDIQSLHSAGMKLVFMSVGAITLVAIETFEDEAHATTEAYLRLQLEYVFSLIISAMTARVQDMFQYNPSFDLQSMLSTDHIMRDIIDESERNNPAPFLVAGIPTACPLSPEVRDKASRVLKDVGDDTENTVFAILFTGHKLVTLVQSSSYRPHQMRVSDLHLVQDFLNRQPGVLSGSELWIPLCLPRFDSSGFMNCYTNCLDADAKLILALISQQGTTEQFAAFRKAAVRIRRGLEIASATESVLEILDSSEAGAAVNVDVTWRRSDVVVTSSNSDEDYVDASGDGDKMIPYVAVRQNDGSPSSCGRPKGPLVRELLKIDDESSDGYSSLMKEYMDLGVMHFVFRHDVPVVVRGKKSTGRGEHHSGHLTQCIDSPLGFPFVGAASKQRVWSIYQRLNLRLRLGSANVESMRDAFDMICQDTTGGEQSSPTNPTIARHCPAMGLVESPPNIQGVTYVTEGTETFLAMNGHGFEL
jgi:hypothetical protein